MSLVTLNKFLNGSRGGSNPAEDPALEGYSDLAIRTLAAMRQSVFSPEPFADLLEEVDSIRKDIQPGANQQILSRCAERVEEVLVRYESRIRQAEVEKADDLRSVLDMLNEGLTYLTSDFQKTETRRQQLENNLTVAARVDDIVVLRKHLSKMLQTVREEARADKGKAEQIIDSMGRHIQQVQKAQARFNAGLPGRAEALTCMGGLLKASGKSGGFHAALFVADSLEAIRERHGEEVRNVILQDLGRKRVQALAPDGQVFHWAPNALLLAWNHENAASSGKNVAEQLRSPCEQRAFVGSRVAIFNVAVRSIVVQPRGDMDELVASLDRFHRRG